jgi:hypothetical protein
MPLKSIYRKTLASSNKNVFLNTADKFKTIKNLLIDMSFAVIIFSGDLFRAATYRLMLVLNKDVLFIRLPESFE